MGREEICVPFADVDAFEVEAGTDSEGDPVFRPLLRLHSGATVLLSLLHVHDRAQVEHTLQELARTIHEYGHKKSSVEDLTPSVPSQRGIPW